DLETIIGSQNSYQVTVDGTAFSVFTSNVRRATRASKKVTICHKGKNTITISENALKAHKAHGDTEGECPPKAETTSPDSETTDDNAQGVNVAAGDFDGDGKAEIVAAMAQDGSTVEIRRGDGSLITSFEAFDTGNGVIVTLGDVTNDGIADIVVGDAGDSQVKVFTFADGQVTQLSTFNIESGTIASLAVAKGIVTPTTDNASSGTTQPTDTKTTTTEQPIVTQPIENPREIYAPQCQTASDGIHISCGGNGMTLTENMTIDSLLSISDVKISGYIHNFGLLSNIVIFANATLSGGTLTGDVENYGIIMDVIFRGHKLKGGKLKGRIAILANVQLRLGIVEDVTLDEDAHLSGGKLQGKIQGSPNKPALLEDTEIADGTHLSHVIIGKGVEMGDNVIMENVSYQETDR
ncbi:MAG: FG-GAP-like repeat-containing protein, partial [Thiotrichaceae bacterium]